MLDRTTLLDHYPSSCSTSQVDDSYEIIFPLQNLGMSSDLVHAAYLKASVCLQLVTDIQFLSDCRSYFNACLLSIFISSWILHSRMFPTFPFLASSQVILLFLAVLFGLDLGYFGFWPIDASHL